MKNIALTQNKCILCKHMIYNINVGCISKVEGLNQFTEKFLLHNQCIYDVSLPKKRRWAKPRLPPPPLFLLFGSDASVCNESCNHCINYIGTKYV